MNFFYSPIFKALDFAGLRSIISLSVFSNFLLLSIPIYTLQVFDRVLASRSNDTLLFLSVGIVIALFIVAISDTLKSYLLLRFANKLEVKISDTLINSIITDSSTNGKNGTVPLRDQEKIKNFFAGQHGLVTFFDAPWVPIFIFIVYMIHPTLSMVLALFMVALFVLTVLTDRASTPHLKKANELAQDSFKKADEIVKNSQMVESMGMRDSMIKYWEGSAKAKSYYQSVASDKAAFYVSLAKLLRYSQTIILTAVGAYLAINNEMTIGGMIAANILASKAAAPMEGIISSWKNFHATKESFIRLNDALEKESNKTEKTKLPDMQGKIQCDSVVFKPNPEQDPIIKGLSFGINAGEYLGIIGPSGSGKSTLAKLLVGIYHPTAGKVSVDDADINIWDKKQFGHSIGYLSQDVTMLTGTVKENISRFTDAKDEDVVLAAQRANAHELILQLPQGYDTPLGAGGHILSGGQRQRIGLARAFFGNPKILVLDEPNSSLDSDGDVALIKALQTMKEQGTTIIAIAHRPTILQQADKLAVLSSGALQLFGPYQEVVNKLIPQNK